MFNFIAQYFRAPLSVWSISAPLVHYRAHSKRGNGRRSGVEDGGFNRQLIRYWPCDTLDGLKGTTQDPTICVRLCGGRSRGHKGQAEDRKDMQNVCMHSPVICIASYVHRRQRGGWGCSNHNIVSIVKQVIS